MKSVKVEKSAPALGHPARYGFVAVAVSMGVAAAAGLLPFPGLPLKAVGWAWVLTLLNAATAHACNGRGLRATSEHGFLFWGLGASMARAGLLIVAIAFVHMAALVPFGPFLAATLSAYFTFLFFEVFYLHRRTERKGEAS